MKWYAEKNTVREKHPEGGWLRIALVDGGDGVHIPNAKLIAAAPELLDELAKAHLVINRLVEEIHKADTKDNKVVERINWPTIGELDRKNVIAKATE